MDTCMEAVVLLCFIRVIFGKRFTVILTDKVENPCTNKHL